MRNKTVLVILLAVILPSFYYLGQRFLWEKKSVPVEFQAAYKDGSLVSRKIAFLGNQSLAGLEQIGHFDHKGDYSDALDYLYKEITRNKEAREQAVLLSSYLSTMTAYLPEVEPLRARALATEALGYEVNLVNHLITLNDELQNLFDLLHQKFIGKEIPNGKAIVAAKINTINEEIKKVNNLNLKFDSTMTDFEDIYKITTTELNK